MIDKGGRYARWGTSRAIRASKIGSKKKKKRLRLKLDSALAHFRVNVRLATLHHPSCSVVTKAARTGCTPNKAHHPVNHKAPVEKEGQNGSFPNALNCPFGPRTTNFLLLSSNACFGGHFPNTGERTVSIRGRQPTKVEGRSGKVKPSISCV